MKYSATFLGCLFFVAASTELSAQRGTRPPVIRKDDGRTLQPLPVNEPMKEVSMPSTNAKIEGGLNLFGAQPTGPRPLPKFRGPFDEGRVLFQVDGLPVTSEEINELYLYYQSFRKGSPALLLQDALGALIPLKVVQAKCGSEEPEMRARMKLALDALQKGEAFGDVVARLSEDDDEDTPADGLYEFGRDLATQPFDRLSHTQALGQLSEPFLTKYGLHVLEVVGYDQGSSPAEDITHVRHILVMWPSLRKLDQEGANIRKVIADWAAASKIEAYNDSVANMLPPEYRD